MVQKLLTNQINIDLSHKIADESKHVSFFSSPENSNWDDKEENENLLQIIKEKKSPKRRRRSRYSPKWKKANSKLQNKHTSVASYQNTDLVNVSQDFHIDVNSPQDIKDRGKAMWLISRGT